jgi:hypothetical protein
MKSLLAILLTVALGLSTMPALADERIQPRMEAALDALQAAKTSKEPLPLLEKARNEVEHAKHNKGGRRPDAIKEIDEAIEQVKQGQSAEAKITHAIAMIHAGMDHGR